MLGSQAFREISRQIGGKIVDVSEPDRAIRIPQTQAIEFAFPIDSSLNSTP